MTGIASTTANLALWRMQWETLFSLPHLLDEGEMDDDEGCRISEIENFGGNPGNLRMFQYVPDGLAPQAPLVVVLHGCTQTAAGYDRSSGWSWLAQEHGFAVLFAQQRGENNPRRCFNWFRPSDITRESGEAASIRNMVTHLVEQHDLDRQRVFVTGLSAGGGMANVMLAAYPDVFSAGAIIAGLPYRSARSVHDALQVMMEGVTRTPQAWGDEVRAASPLGDLANSRVAVSWPRVAVWHGLGDDVVRPSNAAEIVKQWTNVHGLDEVASDEEEAGGTSRMRWRNAEGKVLIEAIAIEHLGHAVPIDASRLDLHEQPGPHFADIGLSSTLEIARFFGLIADDTAPGGGQKAEEAAPEAVAAEKKIGADVLANALAVLPPALRGRRARQRRESAGRSRPAVAAPPAESAPLPVEPRLAERRAAEPASVPAGAQPQVESAIADRAAAEPPPAPREAEPAVSTKVEAGTQAAASASAVSGSSEGEGAAPADNALAAGKSALAGILARVARLLGLSDGR